MKIYTASPLPLSRHSWNRDITVLYRGFDALGHEAACVRLHSKDGADFPGVLQISLNEMESPAWWTKQACDLVVLNSWGKPRHTPIATAIKSAGSKLVVRLDSDGFNSPWNGFARYLRGTVLILRERKGVLRSWVEALARTFLYSIPSFYDLKMFKHLDLADVIGIESEGARYHFTRLLGFYRRPDLAGKLHVIRHPVVPEINVMNSFSAQEKANRILCVGRWETLQKNAPMLVKTLGATLPRHPHWRAEIYGSGKECIDAELNTLSQSCAKRIIAYGPQPHETVLRAFQGAKICLFTSLYESGPIAANEALCLGCTIVGPPDVPSMHDLCHDDFGTLPESRDLPSMTSALSSEINKWENGNRNPYSIREKALSIYSAKSVCQKILHLTEPLTSNL